MSVYLCEDCGWGGGDPAVISEDDVMASIADGELDFSDLDHAMGSVGCNVCPECRSPALQDLDC